MDAQEAKKSGEVLRQQIYDLWNKTRKEFGTAGIQRIVGEYCADDLTTYAAAHSAQVEAELQDVKGQLSTAIGNWKLALDERAAAEAELVKLQTRLRREWWNNHGCKDFRYGDDGEMQCSGCGGDFLRQPFDELEAHVKKTRWDALCRAGAKLVAEGKDFGSLSGEALGETGPEEK